MSSSDASATPSPDDDFEPFSVNGKQSEVFDIESLTLQASRTIVIHPGSSHLRIGRASDPQPVLIPHVIAWRHKAPNEQKTSRMKLLRQSHNPNIDELGDLNHVLLEYCGRQGGMVDEVLQSNREKQPEMLEESCGWTWTSTVDQPDYLIGDDALYIDEQDCYDLFWPIVNGQLNVDGKSRTAVLADLAALWKKAVEKFLLIPLKEIFSYRCILIIPDIYHRKDVKDVISMLFLEIGFSYVLVHQESVCAMYGCGIANACVVDVGHQKTSVCCVEDGFSHPDTRICLDIGGCDVTTMFAWLLELNEFPYLACDNKQRMDNLLLEELKETFCHLDIERVLPEHQEFNLRRPGQSSLLYPITLGEEALQAPMSLFFPKVYGIKSESSYVHVASKNSGDFSDPFDDTYLTSTRTKQEEAWAVKREKAAAASKLPDEKVEDCVENPEENIATVLNTTPTSETLVRELLGVDQAIVWSIENCPDSYEDELKRRMYSCILLVGGGLANFSGVEAFIKRRVSTLLPANKVNMASHVQVITKPKGHDPSITVWKGGTVLSSLENAQELWVKREDWFDHGLRILRENCAFLW